MQWIIKFQLFVFPACLKEEYKHTIVKEHTLMEGNVTRYPNCTMPWHQSMLGEQNYNESIIRPCTGDDAYILYRLDYDFISNGTKFKIPSCPGRLIVS